MMDWIKSLSVTKLEDEPERHTIVYLEDRVVEIPDSIPMQELRRIQFLPSSMLDELEADRMKSVGTVGWVAF